MPGPLDQNTDEGVGATLPNVSGPIDRTGFFENVGAGYRAAQAGPGSTRSRQNAHEAKIYDQMISALTAEGEMGADKIEVRPGSLGYRGPKDLPVNQFGVGLLPVARKFRNPYTDKPSLSQRDNPLARLYLEGDTEEKGAIWEAIKRVRLRKKDFLANIPDEAALATLALNERNRRRAEAETVTSRAGKAGTVGAFIGGMAGSLVAGDPENAVGGGVTAAGKTVARQVVQRAVQEGAANAVAGAVALPTISQDMERLGDGPMTAKDAVRSVVEQAALGAAIGGTTAAAPAAARKVGQAVAAVGGAAVDAAARVAPDAVMAAALRAGTVRERELLGEYRKLHSPYSVNDTSTPTERAAINVVERDVETREASPLPNDAHGENEGRLDAIAASLGVDIKPPPLPTTTPVQAPTVPQQGGPRRAASYEEAVHKAEGTGKNPDSSANGHFQFIDSTWLEYAPRVANTAGMSRSQILALRQDRGVATKAERLFRGDNAKYLRDRGVEDSAGNLSLAHFLGKTDAARVLRADPNTPISQVVRAESIAANRPVFNGKRSKITTAGEMAAWAHRRIGASVDHVPARPDAVPAPDVDYGGIRPYETAYLRPDEIETDAALMQYKGGGDESGVTGKLRNVTAWNPILSSEIMVWEGLDGRRVVVDGHQRTGLAKRLYADDPSIQLPSIIIREADGITPEQARTLGALGNINLGTGTLIDNARVLRDAPNGASMLQGAETRRAIQGLAGLNHEAFGAVLNDVIDPEVAAQIGLNAPEPDTHMAMVDLLLKNRIRNPAEAGSIVRQARADGFGSPEAEQLGMFGDAPTTSLYVPIARILAAAEKRLRDEKRTFRTLSERAGAIEGAGNVLDRGANQERVVGAAEAQAILSALAYRSGPIRDALIAAARAELSGARRSDAVAGFLDALGETDLRAAAAGLEPDGRSGEPFGSEGGGDAAASPDGDIPDSLEPSLFDQAVDVAAKAEAFSDPVGAGARNQTDLLTHDLLMDAGVTWKERNALIDRLTKEEVRRLASDTIATRERRYGVKQDKSETLAQYEDRLTGFDDNSARQNIERSVFEMDDATIRAQASADPAIADRQAQEVQLRADSPMRPGDIDADGTMGLALFDMADQPTFRLDDEGDARPIADIMAEAEADEAAAINAKACLK